MIENRENLLEDEVNLLNELKDSEEIAEELLIGMTKAYDSHKKGVKANWRKFWALLGDNHDLDLQNNDYTIVYENSIPGVALVDKTNKNETDE